MTSESRRGPARTIPPKPAKIRRKAQPRPAVSVLVALNKPFDVLTQFTDDQGRQTLKDFVDMPGIYPAGRLDRDSEGLLRSQRRFGQDILQSDIAPLSRTVG